MRSLCIAAVFAGIMFLPQARAQQADTTGGNLATTKQTANTGLPLGKPGPGMVWVDAKKRVFYHQGDAKYGKTKKGTYMSEGDALNSGYLDAKQKPSKKTP